MVRGYHIVRYSGDDYILDKPRYICELIDQPDHRPEGCGDGDSGESSPDGQVCVTEAMLAAAEEAFGRFWAAGAPDEADRNEFFRDIFRSMLAAKPE